MYDLLRGRSAFWWPDLIFLASLCFSESGKSRKRIDLKIANSLKWSSWDPKKKSAIIIHGFNGTERKTPMTILRDGKTHI